MSECNIGKAGVVEMAPMSVDFQSLTLTEIIRLQNQLSDFLVRRYEKFQAIAFSDVVGSTAYFSRFGNEAGRRLLQRHNDLIVKSLVNSEGRIVDTAGDGVLLCFPHVTDSLETMSRFQALRVLEDHGVPSAHHLCTRTAIHWGPVLTDGVITTGDPVNLCAKVVANTMPEEIYVTQAAFFELSTEQRLRCRPVETITVAGIKEPIEAFSFVWTDIQRFPTAVVIEETGKKVQLPLKALITFGRLREMNGTKANDIVLAHKDSTLARHVSRWHFEVRRVPEGLILRSLSIRPTEVDGVSVSKGQEAVIRAGSVVRLSNVLTLQFISCIPTVALEDDAPTVIY